MKKDLKIGNKIISTHGKPFIIAEAGVNYYDIANKSHLTAMDAAKLMIKRAAISGADAIKFQTYKANKLVIKNSPAYWDTTEETCTTQYELFNKYDKFGEKDYHELALYANKIKIIFISTPFDEEAVDFLDELMPIFKISSSDITNFPLLKYVARKKKPIFLSTGASTIDEINEAVEIIRSIGNNEIALLHCVLNYPTKYEHANLQMIETLNSNFPDFHIGYSDHTLPDKNMLVLCTAFLKGAIILEKHFTLDKSIKGNDHYHAMNTKDLRLARHNLELIRLLISSKEIISDTETVARKYARRSLVSETNILKGTILTANMITCKRPGIGIPPGFFDSIVGKKAAINIKEDSIIQWNMLEW